MENNIIETTNSRIDEILAARAAELAAGENALEDAKAAFVVAQNRADIATAATDVDGYCSAYNDMEKAARTVEVYEARMKQLRGKRIVSVEEDANTMAAIRTYQKELQEKATAEILDLLSKIEDVGKQYWSMQDRANDLIWRWHKEICQQPHPLYPTQDVWPQHLSAADDELRSTIRSIVTLYFYRKHKGVDQYHGVGTIWTK